MLEPLILKHDNHTTMLRWRLLLGTVFVLVLVGLCWLDHRAALPGVWLLPVAALVTALATAEMLYLLALAQVRPLPWVVYGGNFLLLAANWLPGVCCRDTLSPSFIAPGNWPMAALAAGVMLAFAAEMWRFRPGGAALAHVAAAVFVLVYIGVLLGLMIQLRVLWGIGALASLIVVVKMCDTGAYFIGKLFGRHKMAPTLSPGKTIEGGLGGLLTACLASYLVFVCLMPGAASPVAGGLWWRSIVFGLLVGGAGTLGDLAESLLKRAVGSKDSGPWLPGFGGLLDLLDSLLLAAPVAWLCWAVGLVGP